MVNVLLQAHQRTFAMNRYAPTEAYHFVRRILGSCTLEIHILISDRLISQYKAIYGETELYWKLMEQRNELYLLLHNFQN